MNYIVSDEYRFVYCIIPKVACTSIKTALAPLFGIDTTGMEIPREDRQPRYVIHRVFNNSDHQVNKEVLCKGLDGSYSEYFRFGFVRNPWDRLVSCYTDKITGKGFLIQSDEGAPELYRNMPFDEFVEAVCATPDEKANGHFRSQHVTVCRPGGEFITDYIGRFENLAEDFSRVAEKIGVKLELPRILHSGRDDRNYRSFYNDRLRDLAGERFRRDVELFGYSF